MIKKLAVFYTFLLLTFITVSPSLAIADPTSNPNNKFGIHISNENELKTAAELINSNGGQWGYVTIVITESERDSSRWQNVFNEMRRLKIIPLVRIASKAQGGTWDAPNPAEIKNWVSFLNSLNWVVKNRYVIIGNEVNRNHEWGGRVDPTGYAEYLKMFSVELKSASENYFVLPAGLDPNAKNTSQTMSETKFILEMLKADPEIFKYVDGWTAHIYPPTPINNYEGELNLVKKDLPVFITETGMELGKYTEEDVSKFYKNAFTNVWNNKRVVAVTPFILNYNEKPFNGFSWTKKDGTFYSFYDSVKNIAKIKGEPEQEESGQIYAAFIQPVIFRDLDFYGFIFVKNNGQSIWSQDSVKISNESTDFNLKNTTLSNLEPGKFGAIYFRAATTQEKGVYTNTVFLQGTKDKRITNSFSLEAYIMQIDKENLKQYIFKLLDFIPH